MAVRKMRVGLIVGLTLAVGGGESLGAILNSGPVPAGPVLPEEPERNLPIIPIAVGVAIVAIGGAVAYRIATKGGKVKGKVKKGGVTVEGMVCTNLLLGDSENLTLDPLDLPGAHTSAQTVGIQGGEVMGTITMGGSSNSNAFEGEPDLVGTDVTIQGDMTVMVTGPGVDALTFSFDSMTSIMASITATNPESFGSASYSLAAMVIDAEGNPISTLFQMGGSVAGTHTESTGVNGPFEVVIPGDMLPAEARGGQSFDIRVELITITEAIVPSPGAAALFGLGGLAAVGGRRRRLAV